MGSLRRGECWTPKTSLTPSLIMVVPVTTRKVSGHVFVSILPFSTIFLLHFGIVTMVSLFCYFSFNFSFVTRIQAQMERRNATVVVRLSFVTLMMWRSRY